ncbi:MAG: protein kinase [Chitinivibrionales bacterium]|nr:protein kinase [Chitinivibrionales bacterium]
MDKRRHIRKRLFPTQTLLRGAMSPAPEQFGRYKVERLLGEGAMGRVYLAQDPVLGRNVAIKVISIAPLLKGANREEYLCRFSVEAKASAQLSHQSIVAVYDAGDEEGIPWIAFQYVEGRSLEDLLKEAGCLPVDRALSIAGDIASALRTAHHDKIIHRDIKPANILIDNTTGIAKLADFGVAKAPWAMLTQEGATLGSPGYMSPEQVDGAELDERSDIFSLGVVMYEMIAGKHPFARETVAATVYATLGGSYVPLREHAPDIPEDLEQGVARCLTPDKEQRLKSADELMSLLQNIDCTGKDRVVKSSLAAKKKFTQQSELPKIVIPVSGIMKFFVRIDELVRRNPTFNRVIDRSADLFVRLKPHAAVAKRRCGKVFMSGSRRLTRFIVAQYKKTAKVLAHNRRLRYASVGVSAGAVVVFVLLMLLSPGEESISESGISKLLSFPVPALSSNHRDIIDSCLVLMNRGDFDEAEEKAAALIKEKGAAAAYGYLLQGRIELEDEEYFAAKDAFEKALELPHGKRVLDKERHALLEQTKRLLTRERAPESLASLATHTLELAGYEKVQKWAYEKPYWLRWNTVRILEAAGKDVDMVEVYILDMNHGGSARTRIRAARKLGELGDKRAIPALKEVKEKGLRDPFVANVASSVLEKYFEE